MRYPQLARRSTSQQRRPQLAIEDSSGGTTVRKHRPDYGLIVIMSLLLLIGAVVVYAIGPGLTQGEGVSENYYSTKQLTAIGLGIIGFIVAAFVPLKQWRRVLPILIVSATAVALLVPIVGEEVNGAHRWIQIAGFSFQAAELVKLALVIWLARFLTHHRQQGSLGDKRTFRIIGGVTLAVAFVIAGLQSDLGSAAVMMAIIGVALFTVGLPLQKLGIAVAALLLITTLAIAISPYRRDRVMTFLQPTADCQAEGYQACQALLTIGSGGMFGKGLGRSVQAYGYLPEPANDSIFAIIAEKFGYVGTMVVIGLFTILFMRLYRIAIQSVSYENRLLVMSIFVWLSTQMIINVGAMIGLLPLKGITLPFISYGGTSIIFVMVAMGIVFNISRYTDLSISLQNDREARRPSTDSSSRVYRRRGLA